MRLLVTGAGGQLGTDLCRHAASMGDDVVALTSADLDVGDPVAVRETIWEFAPDVIVNAAAWTAVDDCEHDPDRAVRVNGLAARWLADAARTSGAHFVHISTDYVFDGTKDGPYDEWDIPNPLSSYGRSKLIGEREAVAAPGATVVRTAWVCGEHGHNMVKTVLGLRTRDELRFVDDQIGSPTFSGDLAPVVRNLAVERMPGVFHATNAGTTSWYGFAREVLELAGEDPGKVVPIATSELDPPRAAPRPANSVLDNRALRVAGLPGLPHYRRSLERVVEALLA